MTRRIGIDLGGSKIAGIMLGEHDRVLQELRMATPRHDYRQVLATIAQLAGRLEAAAGPARHVGIGMPGSISAHNGLVQNANSTWMNGRDFGRDIEQALGRPVRLANDANCFALSEAADGAARDAAVVFGVIIGTGCGGGLVVNRQLVQGRHHIAGEWGHTPLPRPRGDAELNGVQCWCGRINCLELWISGSGLERDHLAVSGEQDSAQVLAQRALAGDETARASLARLEDRLARGLAQIVNIIDPDMIVLGGGLSNIAQLYSNLPGLMSEHVFADHFDVTIAKARYGDASGVRGAARLWDGDEEPDRS